MAGEHRKACLCQRPPRTIRCRSKSNRSCALTLTTAKHYAMRATTAGILRRVESENETYSPPYVIWLCRLSPTGKGRLFPPRGIFRERGVSP